MNNQVGIARGLIFQGLFKYEVKTKIGNLYGELKTELQVEIDRLKQSIIKSKDDMPDVTIKFLGRSPLQYDELVISRANLSNSRYYLATIQFYPDKWEEIPDSPRWSLMYFDGPVEEK